MTRLPYLNLQSNSWSVEEYGSSVVIASKSQIVQIDHVKGITLANRILPNLDYRDWASHYHLIPGPTPVIAYSRRDTLVTVALDSNLLEIPGTKTIAFMTGSTQKYATLEAVSKSSGVASFFVVENQNLSRYNNAGEPLIAYQPKIIAQNVAAVLRSRTNSDRARLIITPDLARGSRSAAVVNPLDLVDVLTFSDSRVVDPAVFQSACFGHDGSTLVYDSKKGILTIDASGVAVRLGDQPLPRPLQSNPGLIAALPGPQARFAVATYSAGISDALTFLLFAQSTNGIDTLRSVILPTTVKPKFIGFEVSHEFYVLGYRQNDDIFIVWINADGVLVKTVNFNSREVMPSDTRTLRFAELAVRRASSEIAIVVEHDSQAGRVLGLHNINIDGQRSTWPVNKPFPTRAYYGHDIDFVTSDTVRLFGYQEVGSESLLLSSSINIRDGQSGGYMILPQIRAGKKSTLPGPHVAALDQTSGDFAYAYSNVVRSSYYGFGSEAAIWFYRGGAFTLAYSADTTATEIFHHFDVQDTKLQAVALNGRGDALAIEIEEYIIFSSEGGSTNYSPEALPVAQNLKLLTNPIDSRVLLKGFNLPLRAAFFTLSGQHIHDLQFHAVDSHTFEASSENVPSGFYYLVVDNQAFLVKVL